MDKRFGFLHFSLLAIPKRCSSIGDTEFLCLHVRIVESYSLTLFLLISGYSFHGCNILSSPIHAIFHKYEDVFIANEFTSSCSLLSIYSLRCLLITRHFVTTSVHCGFINVRPKFDRLNYVRGIIKPSALGQALSTFHYTLLDKCRALLSVVERGWPNALDFSLDLELNIQRIYYLMNNSFMECFVHHLMNCNCTCVRSTTLDNFALDQTSLDTLQSSRLHSTSWPNALDISLNMHVERCTVKTRERLARA